MSRNMLDFDAINAQALSMGESLLRDWFPAGRLEGREYVCGDWQGNSGKSLKINIDTGKGADFASGEAVGDFVGIYSQRFNVDRVAAARELSALLGLNSSTPATLPPPSKRENNDAEKLAKLQNIYARCFPVAGTPAQAYLVSRGLKGCNTKVFRYYPNKRENTGGALACLAFNDAGELKAIQRVAITQDGRKNTALDIVKRTNGFPSGNPVRIPRHPGVDASTPIIVCEGPEDGITLSNATGFEVWVACGLHLISKIPHVPNRQYLIVRDNDALDSPADLAINKAMFSLLDRGFENILCARPPEGVKDANALLQAVGIEAVTDMVNQAQPLNFYNCQDAQELPSGPAGYDDDCLPVYDEKDESVFKQCAFLSHTDVGNAKRISLRWGHIVKYADGLGWLIYSRGKWSADLSDYRVLNMAAITAIEIQNEMKFAGEHMKDAIRKWSKKSQSGSAINYALKLSRAHLAITSSQLDHNPFFFNCANGVLDLQTGTLLKHNSEYLLTRQSNIAYNPDAECPTWLKFLNDIFPENKDIIPFIQRAVGYSLTGDTREQCMFILHGIGSNGKTTFLETLQGIVGDYWVKTKADTFMERDRSDSGVYLYMLRGARMVTASETKSNRSLDEALIKEATGDSFIVARRLYQSPITFEPTFKLWLTSNYKPEIRGTDEGIWRRVVLIPFDARFYDADDADAPADAPVKDKMLMAKLKSELPGIFAWAVKGCLEWQRIGLAPPASVVDATKEYRNEMDILGLFLDECCSLDHNESIACKDLYTTYKTWCEDNGHRPYSQNSLGRQIYSRGFKKSRTSTGAKAYSGLALKDDLVQPRQTAWYSKEYY